MKSSIALRPRKRGRSAAHSIVVSAALIVAAIGVGAAATGATYARWNASAALEPATISAGTAALSITPATTFPTTPLYPGGINNGLFTVQNTGNTPLALSVMGLSGFSSPTNLSGSLIVSVGLATAATCSGDTYTKTWTGTAATAPAGLLGVTVPAGGSTQVCLGVAVSLSAPIAAQSLSATGIVVTIGGAQP